MTMKPFVLIVVFYATINAAVYGVLCKTLGKPVATLPTEPVLQRVRKDIVFTMEEMGLTLLLKSAAFAAADRPQLVVFGASGAAGGLRPNLLQPGFPEYQVSSLAMGGANMTEVKQAMDEFLWAAPAAIVRQSVAVLVIGYHSFIGHEAFVKGHRPVVPPSLLFKGPPESDITQASRRSPAILDPVHPLRLIMPRSAVVAAKQRLLVWRQLNDWLPWSVGEWLARWPKWRFQTPAMSSDQEINGPVVSTPPSFLPTDFEKWSIREQVAYVTKWLGPGPEVDRGEQEMFTACLRQALQSGMRVIVVDMPLPSEHRRHARMFATFKPTLQKLVAPFLSGGNLVVIDLTEALGDENFSDFGHARPESAPEWTRVFVERLRPLVAPPPPNR
jgi:hypothetical protein